MKKKGFTLVELLAVIVILGIITVIAVPKVLDIINKSRESASNSSIKLVKDAIKTQVASSDLTGPVFTKETDGCYLFNFDDQTSGNAKALEIKNKDKISGSIKYCNNTFSDDTLKFDGNSISKDDTSKKVSGVFIAMGTASADDLAKKIGVVLKNNSIQVDENMQTNIKGIYACGDCTGGLLQINKAVYEGAKAALHIIANNKL